MNSKQGVFRHCYFMLFILLVSGQVSGQKIGEYSLSGRVVKETIVSDVLEENKVGLQTERAVFIYLPPSYSNSEKSFPVVYYLHNIYSDPLKELNQFDILQSIDKSMVAKELGEFILVAGDFTSATTGSWYENSSTSGRWLDFVVEELVPFIESKYLVTNNQRSRALTGYFVGGRGALKLAMEYPDIFGVVYAMHPVATGTGYEPTVSIGVDWEKIHSTNTYQDIEGLGRTTIYLNICQAFLPNPDRPPFYCDSLLEKLDDEVVLNPEHNLTYRRNFLLDGMLDERAENLRKLHAMAFDWGRFDQTQAHVISARRFSKLLTEFGIEHIGEEFAGNERNKYEGENGRFNTRVIPFLKTYLAFE